MRNEQSVQARYGGLHILFWFILFSAGCAHPPVSAVDPIADTSSAADYAAELIEMAVEAEPWITPALVYLSGFQKGEMIGLEFRFKTLESTTKKIEARMAERGYSTPSDVPIRDALRYTMQLGDQPAGHHDQSIAYVLATMEGLGHRVIVVKNYWPRGDDYSGVNTILEAPNGLAWELQFHTPQSFELKMSSHKIYEQVRQAGVPVEKRQTLYIQVSAEWDAVPIPAGILVPGSLHPMEEVILRPRP